MITADFLIGLFLAVMLGLIGWIVITSDPIHWLKMGLSPHYRRRLRYDRTFDRAANVIKRDHETQDKATRESVATRLMRDLFEDEIEILVDPYHELYIEREDPFYVYYAWGLPMTVVHQNELGMEWTLTVVTEEDRTYGNGDNEYVATFEEYMYNVTGEAWTGVRQPDKNNKKKYLYYFSPNKDNDWLTSVTVEEEERLVVIVSKEQKDGRPRTDDPQKYAVVSMKADSFKNKYGISINSLLGYEEESTVRDPDPFYEMFGDEDWDDDDEEERKGIKIIEVA